MTCVNAFYDAYGQRRRAPTHDLLRGTTCLPPPRTRVSPLLTGLLTTPAERLASDVNITLQARYRLAYQFYTCRTWTTPSGDLDGSWRVLRGTYRLCDTAPRGEFRRRALSYALHRTVQKARCTCLAWHSRYRSVAVITTVCAGVASLYQHSRRSTSRLLADLPANNVKDGLHHVNTHRQY